VKLPLKYDEIGLFQDGLAYVVSGKKYGLVNEKGELVCKPQFAQIYHPNSDGIRIAAVKKNKKAQKEFDGLSTYTVITKEGKMMFPANYGTTVGSYTRASLAPQFVSQFADGQDTLNTELGYIRLGTLKNPCIYDLEGNLIYDDTRRNAILQEVFGSKGKVGNKNMYGPYTDFTPLEDVLRLIYNQKGAKNQLNVVLAYYDLKEQKLIKYYTSTYSKGKTILQWNPDEEIGLLPFSEGFAVAHLKQTGNQRSELIDRAGNVVATFPYLGCMSYKNGYAVAKNNNNKWGVIDAQQNQVLPYRFDEAAAQVNGKEDNLYLQVKEGTYWGVVDLKNTTIVPFEYDALTTFEGSDAIFANKNNRLGVFEGTKQILPCDYDSLKQFRKDAFVCVRGKEVSVYSLATKKMSDTYVGFTRVFDADQELHNGSFFELYTIQNVNDTVYGYIDGKAEIVVPFVFNNTISAERAYKHFRNLPTQEFGELELYRMLLRFSVRERTYTLDAIVPNNDWDY
ncbi:MAG: WG repeat-containing protein, partial [Paludibacteraceae bacterium]|nr:WG repeat-containing protein [Paludibacteraceae bacterium]